MYPSARATRGVSPVIGVILMVAITVILAAIVATFVFGLSDDLQRRTPQAGFTFDYDASTGELDITHNGGDTLDAATLTAVVADPDGSVPDASPWTGTVSAGTTVTLGGLDGDETVRVVWNDGESSATLGRWTGPDA
ncbi:type IV pilin [Natronomonas sp. EA1]|uniref:type IV pilin n=1 Tax=Natronomonas sp. EA1 TaxID=3421655 RepID=UPI003EBCE409